MLDANLENEANTSEIYNRGLFGTIVIIQQRSSI